MNVEIATDEEVRLYNTMKAYRGQFDLIQLKQTCNTLFGKQTHVFAPMGAKEKEHKA